MRGRHDAAPGTDREQRHDYWGVVLDADDAPRLARFYAEVLGWRVLKEEADWCTIAPDEGVGYLAVQRSEGYLRPTWPNASGQQQMMLHLDVEVSDLDDAVAHAVELGAELAAHQPQDEVRVLLDPAGHPFCLYADG